MDEKKKPTPIDVDKIDLERMKEKVTDLPGLIQYAHSVGGFAIAPTQKGEIKGSALKAMHEQTQSQMDQIMEQMKLLATQAKKLQARVDISHEIYHAEMGFKPVIGKNYFLYQKKDSQVKVLSLIGPDEWGNSQKFSHCIAEVKLLADHTWDVIRSFEEKN